MFKKFTRIFDRKARVEDAVRAIQKEASITFRSFDTKITDLYNTREQILKEIREVKDELQRIKKD